MTEHTCVRVTWAAGDILQVTELSRSDRIWARTWTERAGDGVVQPIDLHRSEEVHEDDVALFLGALVPEIAWVGDADSMNPARAQTRSTAKTGGTLPTQLGARTARTAARAGLLTVYARKDQTSLYKGHFLAACGRWYSTFDEERRSLSDPCEHRMVRMLVAQAAVFIWQDLEDEAHA